MNDDDADVVMGKGGNWEMGNMETSYGTRSSKIYRTVQRAKSRSALVLGDQVPSVGEDRLGWGSCPNDPLPWWPPRPPSRICEACEEWVAAGR